MSTGQHKRKRPAIPRPKSSWKTWAELIRNQFFWQRFAVCLIAVFMMWMMTRGWEPPFAYRLGDVPSRNLNARVDFEYPNWNATAEKRQQARANVLCYYENSAQPLEDLPNALADRFFSILGAESFEDLDPSIIDEFIIEADEAGEVTEELRRSNFDAIRQALVEDMDGSKVRRGVEHALLEHNRKGMLNNLEHDFEQGSTRQILVFENGDPLTANLVEVSHVRVPELLDPIREKLKLELTKEFSNDADANVLADYVFHWIQRRLPTTLNWDQELTDRERSRVAADVPLVMTQYKAGEPLERSILEESISRGIEGGRPLSEEDLNLLRVEHQAYLAQRSWSAVFAHVLASFGMYAAVFSLCGFYLHYRDRRLIGDLKQLIAVVATASLTICVVWFLAVRFELWHVELIPLVIFTMTISIAYRQELGLLLTALVSFVATMSMGQGLPEFVVMVATSAAAALLSGFIRSRTRLVYVGLVAAAIGFPTTIGVNILDGEPIGPELLIRASWVGFSAVIGGLLMTALLPFLERTLNLETDISLLEIGDAGHPLLQELVRRAPGTYNHSINVASIAEAAAESIGANGLLCRVGAYFHDIGKMLKPEYFIENQGQNANKHESLNPAMSKLVIVAHVKEGIELAREHHLPQRIVDLIEQHHGTTLVEYFYRRATQKSEETGEGPAVDESSFRYPGPKPQSKEAAVMMLSDAVESASRTLVDPAPARIESLVHELSRKRLDDGQFDECSLSLKEIKKIEASLIKSMTAVYHGRVKYTDQQSA